MNTHSASKHFLVMAGGTGGHVYPALSIAGGLIEKGHEVSWLGTKKGIESRLVPSAGIPLHCIDVTGLRGKGAAALLKAPLNLLRSLFQARKIIRTLQPDAVLGFGGFASGPGGLMSRLCGIPLLIHEQNARAGTTNKLLSRFATKVFTAFPNTLAKAEVVGNPVREDLTTLDTPEMRAKERSGPIRMLVLGGSLGATFLNETVAKALAGMVKDERPQVLHQCGERWLENCQQSYAEAGVDADAVAYIEDMASAYRWADFVVCRSGAMTVSEVAAVGIPAMFVPFPHAIDDHQTANAQWLAEGSAATVVQQSDLSPTRMQREIQRFLTSRETLASQGSKIREKAFAQATHRLIVCSEELAHVA